MSCETIYEEDHLAELPRTHFDKSGTDILVASYNQPSRCKWFADRGEVHHRCQVISRGNLSTETGNCIHSNIGKALKFVL